jgi:4-hydroxy-3-methylbut-2-enyl diphosphate reductase
VPASIVPYASSRLLALADAPVYVRHEIVHNHSVVQRLKSGGAVFVESAAEIPPGAWAVISAHGAAPTCIESWARAGGACSTPPARW